MCTYLKNSVRQGINSENFHEEVVYDPQTAVVPLLPVAEVETVVLEVVPDSFRNLEAPLKPFFFLLRRIADVQTRLQQVGIHKAAQRIASFPH